MSNPQEYCKLNSVDELSPPLPLSHVPLWFEVLRFCPEFWVSVKGICGHHDNDSLGDDDTADLYRLFADPLEASSRRIQAQRLVDHAVQILHLHQSFILDFSLGNNKSTSGSHNNST